MMLTIIRRIISTTTAMAMSIRILAMKKITLTMMMKRIMRTQENLEYSWY
jgi:hypothetical protein